MFSGNTTHISGSGLLFDFNAATTLPAGLIAVSGTAPSWSFSSGLLTMTGDADAAASSYPIRIDRSFSGDWLFQISTLIDNNGGDFCTDASVAVFNVSSVTQAVPWFWGVSPGRISAQNNCPSPNLYGASAGNTAAAGGVLNFSNQWITMHLRHQPSAGVTRYSITQGKDDWLQSSAQISDIQISQVFGGPYFVGIAADNDTPGRTTRFSGFRASPL